MSAPEWAAPLPDFTRAAVTHRFKVGEHRFRIALSAVQHSVPFEPHTDLVQMGVFYGENQPLTAYDLGVRSPEAAANLWGYLTNRITETVVQFYAPRPRETGEPNPRLGCWGPRPDLVQLGIAESDVSIAGIIGVSIWTPGGNPPPVESVFLEALRDTLVEVLTYWVVTARRTVGPVDRRN